MKKRILLTALLLISIVLFSGIQSCNNEIQHQTESSLDALNSFKTTSFLPHPAFAQASGDISIADIAEKSIESVVNIYSTKVIRSPGGNFRSPFFDDPFFKRFFGPNFQFEVPPSEQREQSLGSGVIVSEDGIILTNNHVIADAEELRVILHDEREFEAEIVGTDPQSDLAVIRLKGDDIEGLKPITFGDSDILRLGDVVLAIGNPFGLSHTVTMGIVSAKGRSFNQMRITEYEDFIQTDAAINPGNSGGALINLRGELVGINTAIVSRSGGYQGIGFAIPSNMAQLIMKGLINEGKIVRGWLGVVIQDVTHEIAEAMDLDSTKGALISEVYKDTPAHKAGIESGDIVLKVNNKEIESSNHLRNMIALLGADEKVTVTVLRDGKEKDIQVKLAERKEDMKLASVSGEREDTIDGLSIAELNQSTRMKYKIPSEVEYGVVITGVEESSSANAAGLQEGDVVREINKKTVESAGMFKKEFKKSKENILLYVYRNGNHIFKVLKKR